MADGKLTVALISEVFFEPGSDQRLHQILAEARARGADLAVLPEIPLNPWSPASKEAREEDAESPGGPRQQRLQKAARQQGIGVIGGAILRGDNGTRHNTALVIDAEGKLVTTYMKVHLPEEPGFWETSHYQPGDQPPVPIRNFAMPFGIQICSDINRPTGSFILAAMGAEVILCPRATEASTFDRWRLVFRANAMTACCYVLSVCRPRPEQGVHLGGPSIVVDPNGEILAETTEPMTVVELSSAVVQEARVKYPGYLAEPASLYAAGWHAAAEERA